MLSTCRRGGWSKALLSLAENPDVLARTGRKNGGDVLELVGKRAIGNYQHFLRLLGFLRSPKGGQHPERNRNEIRTRYEYA